MLIAAEVSSRVLDGLALIGVDGAGGSGKSTLARALAEVLGADGTAVSVVHGDDFYRVAEPEARLALSPAEGYERYFHWERLRDQVLVPLASGRAAEYQRYDWTTGALAPFERHPVPAEGYVLVEGMFTARPELEGYYDLTVFVDTPLDVCMERLAARGHAQDHGPGDWLQRWQESDKYYFANTEPWARLDMVVKGL
jgi:uridine kinase